MLEKYALIRALETVLKNPLKKFSITELAKRANLAPSAAKYCLDYMKDKKLVRFEKIGKTHQYQADLKNFLTRQWKILFFLEKIHEKEVVEYILKNVKQVTSIVLYGSVAQGTDDEKSDIDIIVIADTNEKKGASGAPFIDGRELNINVFTPAEWRKNARSNKIFYEHVVMDSIVLYGERPVVL